jgi:dCTP deaminase
VPAIPGAEVDLWKSAGNKQRRNRRVTYVADPGFGHAGAGGTGSRGVLEVRCHEAPFALDHGQVVGRLVYEHMAERPEILYGRDMGSNYQGQGLKLSKHFRAG